jgi:ATP-dependent helicase/DNAse subunit B
MGLKLIIGPPNSGRAGQIRRELEAALPRDPLLLVPTSDDADRFEQELAAEGILGASIVTFHQLFAEIGRAIGTDARPSLTEAQRLRVLQLMLGEVELRQLRRSARRPGFLPALAALLDELAAAGAEPGSLEERAERVADPGAAEVARILGAYEARRDGLGRGDPHRLARDVIAGLLDEETWARPLFAYGFDDLTEEQFDLIAALSSSSDVTVALTYEDRPALAARGRLHSRLIDLEPGEVEELSANGDYTKSETLYALERGFASPDGEAVEPDGGLVLLRSAGARSESEAIAAEVKRLLSEGTEPGEIAIVVRTPSRRGALLEQLLTAYGVPAAVEGGVPLSRTATGRALAAILRVAFDSADADAAFAYLRAPGRASPAVLDELERRTRRGRLRTANEIIEELRGPAVKSLRDRVEALREARESGALSAALATAAREIAERPAARRAAIPSRTERLELRAAAEAGRALDEIVQLELPDPSPTEVAHLLDALTVPFWRGPATGRVRVLAPYRLRAHRYKHVFVASLQDGEFPRRESELPILSEDRREGLGLPARADPIQEERYLFHVCLSRPTDRLYLSWRSSDEDGRAVARSPFLDDVRDLLAPPRSEDLAEPDPIEEEIGSARSLREVVHDPAAAPTERELARSLAVRGRDLDQAAALAGLGIEDPTAGRIARGLAAAAERLTLPGPLRTEAVRSELAARPLFGASTLESYEECPYRWFVDHELDPEPLGPKPEAMVRGGVVHRVLERLYRDAPSEGLRPRPETLAAWRRRALELVEEETAERGLQPTDAPRRADYRLIEAMVIHQLEREAESELPLQPDPALVEASFGKGGDDAKPPLEIDGFGLHGRIDRIDVIHGEGRRPALVRDYKSSREATAGEKLEEEGKLQLPLYMIAARELWGLDPVAAVYEPLGARGKRGKPRGLLNKDERDGLLPEAAFVKGDFIDGDELEQRLAAARQRATEIVGGMREGLIDRDPIGGECPFYCAFQPICRRERAPRSGEEITATEERGE